MENAILRHGNSGCIEGTRTEILEDIYRWANKPDKPIYWLKGSQGTGKSAITRTIAEKLDADGRLGASFVFSEKSENQRDLDCLFVTLAFQLAWKDVNFRNLLLCQPSPRHRPIISSLRNNPISTVFVIDALDEFMELYRNGEPTVLSHVLDIVSNNPNVKFFIAGRPEKVTRRAFRKLGNSKVQESSLDVEAREDVRRLFEHNLEQIKRNRNGLDDWPAVGDITLLCERATWLVPKAMEMVQFIGRGFQNPRKQLDILLDAQTPGKQLYTLPLDEIPRDTSPKYEARSKPPMGSAHLIGPNAVDEELEKIVSAPI